MYINKKQYLDRKNKQTMFNIVKQIINMNKIQDYQQIKMHLINSAKHKYLT